MFLPKDSFTHSYSTLFYAFKHFSHMDLTLSDGSIKSQVKFSVLPKGTLKFWRTWRSSIQTFCIESDQLYLRSPSCPIRYFIVGTKNREQKAVLCPNVLEKSLRVINYVWKSKFLWLVIYCQVFSDYLASGVFCMATVSGLRVDVCQLWLVSRNQTTK